MNSMLIYFIKSGFAMALFYGIYRIFMEKDTNFSLNRYYLMGTLFLSLMLPVLPIEKIFIVEKTFQMPVMISLDGQGLTNSGIAVGSAAGSAFHLNAYFLAKIVYITGVVLLISTLIFQLLRLLFIRKVGIEKYGVMKVIFVNGNIIPFSILNRIYLNRDTRRDPKIKTILDHEYAHYRFLHSIDLILLEFISIFQWFNPFIWLYIRSLKEIHEFQADEAVLRNGEGTGSYRALLVNQLTGTEVFRLTNGFSKSLTKKRMIMMTKMKSKKGAWLKALMAVPVLAILLIAYTAHSNTIPVGDPVRIKGKVVEAESGELLPGVSVLWKGHTTGTVTDMSGDFMLELPDKNPVLTYSFVGFKTATTKGAGPFTVKMERKTFQITEPVTGAAKVTTKKGESKEKAVIKDIPGPKEVFYIVEDMPKFQGGDYNTCKEYVQKHLEYPQEAKAKGLQGIVHVFFVVNGKGKVSNAKVKRAVDPQLDKAALKAVNSMPDWTPGRQREKPVAVQFEIPVEFKL